MAGLRETQPVESGVALWTTVPTLIEASTMGGCLPELVFPHTCAGHPFMCPITTFTS
jgi:hypothetical protein